MITLEPGRVAPHSDATRPGSRFLDLRALAALGNLRFTTRQRIEGAYSGRHRSRHRSGSGEFVDYREYSAGEDLRRLDWKVFGRTGKAYVRLYEDETNVVCTLAVDASGSMRFGGFPGDPYGSKLEYAQFLATGLSHLISRGQDQVGLALLEDGLREFLAPGATPDHVARIQSMIAEIGTTPAQVVAPSLSDLFQCVRSRGVLLFISDFLFTDIEAAFGALRLFKHRQFEVIALHLVHPHEERLPEGTAFRFDGLENDGHVDCSPAEIRQMYEQRFADHLAAIRTLALATGCDYRRVSTAIPWINTLQGFLAERTPR
jgi:uncharacterized protein (DUF58 family)